MELKQPVIARQDNLCTLFKIESTTFPRQLKVYNFAMIYGSTWGEPDMFGYVIREHHSKILGSNMDYCLTVTKKFFRVSLSTPFALQSSKSVRPVFYSCARSAHRIFVILSNVATMLSIIFLIQLASNGYEYVSLTISSLLSFKDNIFALELSTTPEWPELAAIHF
ncbi:hypothetical protein FF38_10013 [Lucilia cuprina]|uniref:Transmembrane protein n=1 Tax=Lucilia cuprina TaxID=7375 RepID=A0A0L0C2Z6_LUCCU|nr:hypothetical protein FF38_10013 [Lucilia cuprina]